MKKGKDEPHKKDALQESSTSTDHDDDEDNQDQQPLQRQQSQSNQNTSDLSGQMTMSRHNHNNSDNHRQSQSTRSGIRLIHDPDEINCGKIRPMSSRDDSFSTSSITNLSFTTNSLGHSSSSFPQPRRRSSLRRPSKNLYNSQLQLLATMTGGSFLAFLFFFLNIFAFASLMMGIASVIMLMQTIYNYGNFLLESGEGALFDFLPRSLQDYLTNTTVHDAMIDDSEFMENRWYFIYFIPGLTNEQRQTLIDRLPQRHRDMAYGPGGIVRLFLPDSLYRMIAPPNARSTTVVDMNRSLPSIMAAPSGGEEMGRLTRNSIGSFETNRFIQPLPIIQEGNSEENNEAEEDQVTMQDAMYSLIHTARSWITGNTSEIPPQTEHIVQGPIQIINDLTMNASSNDDVDETVNTNAELEVNVLPMESDDDQSDLGIDLDPDDMAGGMNEGQLRRFARYMGLSPEPMNPSTPNVVPATPSSPETPYTPVRPRIIDASSIPFETVHTSNVSSTAFGRALGEIDEHNPGDEIGSVAEQTLEEQQELEGDIITLGLEWMVNHYTNQASDSILSFTNGIVEGIAPSIIRMGSRLSGLSALGLIGIYSSFLQQPLQIMGRSLGGERRSRTEERFATGLTLTLALGAVSAGSAYVARNLLRGMTKALKSKNDDKKNKN